MPLPSNCNALTGAASEVSETNLLNAVFYGVLQISDLFSCGSWNAFESQAVYEMDNVQALSDYLGLKLPNLGIALVGFLFLASANEYLLEQAYEYFEEH